MVWNLIVQRLRDRLRDPSKRKKNRRSLRLETLTKRQLLASDIGAITGTAFSDLTGDGQTADDIVLAGATVELFLDDGNGTFGAEDGAAILNTTTDANGDYAFNSLSIGTYHVVQQAVAADLTAPSAVTIAIDADAADGTTLTTIDDFSTGDQIVTATAATPTMTQSTTAGSALGGARDVQLNLTNATGNTTFQVDTANNLLSLSTGGGATASAIVEYDGTDGSFGLNVPPGFAATSLTGAAAGSAIPTDTGLEILTRAENQAEMLTVTVFTSATQASEAQITIPQNATAQSVFLEFTDPAWVTSTQAGITGPADFSNVIAVQAEATVTLADNDIFFSVLESRGPDPITANLANQQTMTLGGTVFSDFGTTTNNGLLDAGESGIAGVVVDLYFDAGAGIDPANQAPIASTATDANGDYSFAGLDPGDYVAVIPETEFVNGEPLFGFLTSTGNDPVPGDDDVDGDDNGGLTAGVGLVTDTITLAPNTESIADGDTDPDTNFTLDFGVTPTIDLEVTKTLDTANSTLVAGGTAVFTISFLNNGPLDATNVVLTDVIPAGLTIDQANSNFGAFTPTINGQNVSVAIGNLAATATGSITLATTIDNAAAANITNTASIAGDEVETDNTNNSDDDVVDLILTDLTITKDDNTTTSVVAGEQFTYTLTVTNNGPDTATGITVTDNLPADLSFVSGTFTTGSGTVTESPAASGQLSITVDDLANAASATIDIVVLVAADAGTSVDNTATVANAPDTDTDDTNNSATETTPIVRNVDVAVTKTANATPVAGDQLTYTFEVTNNGPGDARGVSVADTLDALLTFNSFDAGTSGVTVNQTGQDLTFTVGTLTSGQTETFTITVDVASSATAAIDNTATISTTDVDTDATNDSSTVSVTPTVDTDLVISKTVDITTGAVPGQSTLTYTFVLSHDTDSVSDSGQVTFTDTLPTGLTGVQIIEIDNAVSTSFDTNMQTATVVYDPIPVGETRSFQITATVNEDATGTVDNTGSFTLAGGETDTTNNSATASTTLDPQFDVSVTKVVDDDTPAPGATVTYTLGLTNAGPSTATGVILSDDVPTGLTFVSGTLEGNAATLSGSTVSFPAITLDSGETQNATLVFTLDVDASGTITNTATVATDAGDQDTTNNTASDDITATPETDLTVAKAVDTANAAAGDTLVYTVTVTNSGSSTAVAATAVDTLPAGVTFVSGTGPNGEVLTATNGVVTFDGGDLAPAASFQLTINATVDAGTSGTVSNSVTVSTTTVETDATNNTATADTVVDPLTASIAGVVYVDADDDGVQDAGEDGIAGVTITLTGTD
ncbi:MAG: SdrD B-like domain-containing protein, partial [Planctomycetota bacterium]